MKHRQTDISELYDLLLQRRGSYLLCFDLKNIVGLNQISRGLGDKALVEMARRIEDAAKDEMLWFRVGSDEFVLVTGIMEKEAAKKLGENILKRNGELLEWQGMKYPIELYCAAVKLPEEGLRYKDLYEDIHSAVMRAKQVDEVWFWG